MFIMCYKRYIRHSVVFDHAIERSRLNQLQTQSTSDSNNFRLNQLQTQSTSDSINFRLKQLQTQSTSDSFNFRLNQLQTQSTPDNQLQTQSIPDSINSRLNQIQNFKCMHTYRRPNLTYHNTRLNIHLDVLNTVEVHILHSLRHKHQPIVTKD